MATKTANHKGRGATQRKKSKKAKQKQPNLLKYYNIAYRPLALDSQEFRAKLIRPDSFDIWLDPMASVVEWTESPGDPVMRGTLELMRPDRTTQKPPNIHDGHRMEMYVTWAGRWTRLFTMDVMEPEDGDAQSWTFDLADPGQVLQESEDDWLFKARKHHKPHGWTCDEIAREIARQYRIPLGKITKGRYRIKHLSGQDISPLAMIQKAYALEKSHTGSKFVMRWHEGRLNITPLRRNPILYTLDVQTTALSVGRKARDEKFATAVTVHGSATGKGKHKHKVKKLVVNEKAIKKYGMIHKKVSSAHVKNTAEANRFGKRYIANHSQRKRTLTGVEHPGIAFIRKGDAVRVPVPDTELVGAKSVVFVTQITKRVEGGLFTMTLDVNQTDAIFTAQEEREKADKEKRAAKRKKRAKTKAAA